ncbi:hypothetical protein [Paenibacillus sp. FSL R5-0486]|uniref:BC1872 family protein n=1 Tax=Paenibacillus sp. FSL R5-0486 TaxID=2921645 RepID=UPI0030DD1414
MTQTALTREQVLAMEPGQELDALVAQHVMGWHKGDPWGGAYWVDSDKCLRYEILVFKPSLHINIAWGVGEWFAETGIRGRYAKRLKEVILANKGECSTFDMVHASPADRCKAALLAVLDL